MASKVIMMVVVLLAVPVLHVLAGPRGLGGEVGAPIDGGISLLVAAGIGYGTKKALARRKAKQGSAENNTAGI